MLLDVARSAGRGPSRTRARTTATRNRCDATSSRTATACALQLGIRLATDDGRRRCAAPPWRSGSATRSAATPASRRRTISRRRHRRERAARRVPAGRHVPARPPAHRRRRHGRVPHDLPRLVSGPHRAHPRPRAHAETRSSPASCTSPTRQRRGAGDAAVQRPARAGTRPTPPTRSSRPAATPAVVDVMTCDGGYRAAVCLLVPGGGPVSGPVTDH